MSYLLDTCFLSELVKPEPSSSVTAWLAAREETDLYVSVLTLGEILKGVERLPDSRRRRNLQQWVERDLRERFHGRWIDVDIDVCKTWGRMLAEAESEGTTLPAVGSLLAASAITRGLTVVTRTTQDFEKTGVKIVNPWN